MKEKIILITIIVALLGGAFYWFQNRKIRNDCEKNCFYIPAKGESGGRLYALDKGNYWIYKTREFETQKQCIDYCLISR